MNFNIIVSSRCTVLFPLCDSIPGGSRFAHHVYYGHYVLHAGTHLPNCSFLTTKSLRANSKLLQLRKIVMKLK